MIKTPRMAKQIDRKVWVSITSLLRFATPLMCAIITGLCAVAISMINNYESRMERQAQVEAMNTQQLNDINLKLAVFIEDYKQVAINTTDIKSLNTAVNSLQIQFARLDRNRNDR